MISSHLRAVLSDPGMVPLPKTSMDFSDMHSGQRRTEKVTCYLCYIYTYIETHANTCILNYTYTHYTHTHHIHTHIHTHIHAHTRTHTL